MNDYEERLTEELTNVINNESEQRVRRIKNKIRYIQYKNEFHNGV